jgi:hypothetical protein
MLFKHACSKVLRRTFAFVVPVLLAGVAALAILAPQAAQAAAPTALILGDSVTPGVAPDGSGDSLEQYEAIQDGFSTTVVTGAQWDAMTASQFAQYQVLIIGDPDCDASGNSFAAALANASTWEPVVMSSGGNKVLIGTDPTFHYLEGHPGDKVEGGGIAFAGAVSGATGAYVDLSCAYDSTPAGTPVPLLDGLSTHGSGQFTVIGEGAVNACATGVNIVANSGPTSGLTDADLSNWNCSVHEAFDKFPSDYTPLALAPSTSGFPSSYCADDVETATLVCGSPYIMVSGGGVTVTSNIKLTPPSQTLTAGGPASQVANVSTSAGPVSGGKVVFNVDSGPDLGATFTGTTDSSGNLTFNYTNTGGPGTDSISATYTDASGVSQKATATVTWVAGAAPTTLTTSLSGGTSSGANISVPPGTPVTDSATLAGANASTAGGMVTYSVFSDSGCTVSAGTPTTVNVTAGSAPKSNPVTLSAPGTYYWTASYTGDPNNKASNSACGTEKETVTSPGIAPVVEDFCNVNGTTSVTAYGLDTSGKNDLVVAYVTADGPSTGLQTVTVSGSGLTWTRIAQENGAKGDAEVWVAHAGTDKTVNVTAKASKAGYSVVLKDVSYKNATGIGASGTFDAPSGAPTGTITTTQDNSWVWGVGFDWLKSVNRTPGAGQTLFSQTKVATNTSWLQSTTNPTPAAGTPVTINDTAPTTDPYDLVLVEIL